MGVDVFVHVCVGECACVSVDVDVCECGCECVWMWILYIYFSIFFLLKFYGRFLYFLSLFNIVIKTLNLHGVKIHTKDLLFFTFIFENLKEIYF